MDTFKKNNLVGNLGLISIDHTIKVGAKIKWTTKQVLTLVDDEGRPFTNAHFRKNAHKKAENFFVELGWEKINL